MPKVTNDQPRFYAACLASYNAGVLHGVWIDATSDVDEMQEKIAEMLRNSPHPNVQVEHPQSGELVPSAEEWAVHDYDGLPSSLGEYPGLQAIADYVERLEEFEEAGVPAEVVAELEEHVTPEDFCGVYESLADYAQEVTESCHEIPEHLRFYIDWEKMAHDYELSGDVFTVEKSYREVYVFSSR